MASAERQAPVPLLDLSLLHETMRDEIDAAIARVLDANTYVLGDTVQRFETHAARYLGAAHAVGVASGTDALLLTLKAAGIGPGDEVITTAFTFFGTVEAILHAGATPVFADIETDGMMLDPVRVEEQITSRTRAIMPVHLYGQMGAMDDLEDIAEGHGVVLIEDAAQAFGATLRDRRTGFGTAACFSFHPTKPLGALGDGGLVATNDEALADQLRRLRDHGSAARYHHVDVGYNSRLDALQAAVLEVKLRHLDTHLATRRKLAANYDQLLADLPLERPLQLPGRGHCFAQYTIRLDARDKVREQLGNAGIASAVHYPVPLYRQPALIGQFGPEYRLPATEAVAARCLSLPLYEGLEMEQQQRVATTLEEILSAAELRPASSGS